MRNRRAHGFPLQSREHLARVAADRRERGRALRRGLAFLDQSVERALGEQAEVLGHVHRRDRDAFEHDAADARFVPPYVFHGQPRAVGAALQVDPIVAERAPDLLEVADGIDRGVLRQVRPDAKRRVAFADLVDRQERPAVTPDVHRWSVELTCQRVGAAGASLVDEDDVAVQA